MSLVENYLPEETPAIWVSKDEDPYAEHSFLAGARNLSGRLLEIHLRIPWALSSMHYMFKEQQESSTSFILVQLAPTGLRREKKRCASARYS